MKEKEYLSFYEELARGSWQSYLWRYVLRGYVERDGTGKDTDVYSGAVHIEREHVAESWPHEPTLTSVYTGTHSHVISGAKKDIENWRLMRPQIMKVIGAELPEEQPASALNWR